MLMIDPVMVSYLELLSLMKKKRWHFWAMVRYCVKKKGVS